MLKEEPKLSENLIKVTRVLELILTVCVYRMAMILKEEPKLLENLSKVTRMLELKKLSVYIYRVAMMLKEEPNLLEKLPKITRVLELICLYLHGGHDAEGRAQATGETAQDYQGA